MEEVNPPTEQFVIPLVRKVKKYKRGTREDVIEDVYHNVIQSVTHYRCRSCGHYKAPSENERCENCVVQMELL